MGSRPDDPPTLTLVDYDAPRMCFDLEAGSTRVLMAATGRPDRSRSGGPRPAISMRWTAAQVDSVIEVLTKLRAEMK